MGTRMELNRPTRTTGRRFVLRYTRTKYEFEGGASGGARVAIVQQKRSVKVKVEEKGRVAVGAENSDSAGYTAIYHTLFLERLTSPANSSIVQSPSLSPLNHFSPAQALLVVAAPVPQHAFEPRKLIMPFPPQSPDLQRTLYAVQSRVYSLDTNSHIDIKNALNGTVCRLTTV